MRTGNVAFKQRKEPEMAKQLPVLRNERARWRYLRADTKAAAARRHLLDSTFAGLFPHGLTESVRFLAEHRDFAPPYEGLEHVHPRAFPLLAAYGLDYTPMETPVVMYEERGFQPTQGRCSENACVFMVAGNSYREVDEPAISYVEGIVIGANIYPMLHAWNGLSTNRVAAIDWTLYATSRWSRYFGVPFTQEEYTHIGGRSLLFHRNNFERYEAAILELLESRPLPNEERPAA